MVRCRNIQVKQRRWREDSEVGTRRKLQKPQTEEHLKLHQATDLQTNKQTKLLNGIKLVKILPSSTL